MAVIHLIEGPVGSGKSTFAAQLSQNFKAPRLTLDDWMTTLFSPDRPTSGIVEWYMERKDRCIDQIWKLSQGIIKSGSDVILELGLIQYTDRERFYDRVDAANLPLKMYVLDAPHEVRKTRVLHRNLEKGNTYSMDVPETIFEMASEMWEPVDESECRSYEVKFISTA